MVIESFLKDYESQGVNDISYNIFSSMEDPFPKACISFTTNYLTPDALGLHRGKACPIHVIFDKYHNKKLEFYVDYWKVKGTEFGMRINVYLSFLGDLGKITNHRKSYKDKNAGDILKDVLSSDIYLNRYKREIEKSDHSFNCFRGAADNSIEFIQNSILPNTLIDNGKPYFFIGLDNVARYVSTNSIAKKGDNVKTYIDLGQTPENKSAKLGTTQKGIDKKKMLNLKTNTYEIDCGQPGDFAELKVKNFIFSPDDYGNFKPVDVLTTSPADKNKSKYPVVENFLFFTDSTSSRMIEHRPKRNVDIEAYNEIADTLSHLLTITAKNCIPNFTSVKELVSAGTQIYVNTLYAYSALNGLYAIKDIEYMYTKDLLSVNLTLVRSFYDMQYPENKDAMETENDKVYQFSPVANKGELVG